MTKIFTLLLLFVSFQSFSQVKNECDEGIIPYWWNETNSRIEGEVPSLKRAFKEIQLNETKIIPANGFITLRLDISKTGELCDILTYQIDKDYKSIEFNNGELKKKLEETAIELTNWKRDKEYKTYNLIRFKIKDGKIEEVF